MFGFLFKLALVVVIGVLVYQYYLGSAEEKARSAKVFGHMKEIAVAVGDLAQSEKEKFEAGKYDAVLDKLDQAYQAAKEGLTSNDADRLKRIGELEQRRKKLEQDLRDIEQADTAAAGKPMDQANQAKQEQRKDALRQDIRKLLEDSDALLKEAER